MMRIIAGQYKNRSIITATKNIKLEANKIRPTTEKVRAAAFNKLQSLIGSIQPDFMSGQKVLDICCGVGSFGLEALSRGASKVCFIDNQRAHLELVKINLERLNCAELALVLFAHADKLSQSHEVYDVVYIDPPYRSMLLEKIVTDLVDKKWVHHQTLLIIETSARERKQRLDAYCSMIDYREYGTSALSYYNLNDDVQTKNALIRAINTSESDLV